MITGSAFDSCRALKRNVDVSHVNKVTDKGDSAPAGVVLVLGASGI